MHYVITQRPILLEYPSLQQPCNQLLQHASSVQSPYCLPGVHGWDRPFRETSIKSQIPCLQQLCGPHLQYYESYYQDLACEYYLGHVDASL